MIVPPFMKYSAGPLLGPALLQAKARERGHECSILDLNAHYIRRYNPRRLVGRGSFVGDHDKPQKNRNAGTNFDLSDIESKFLDDILSCTPDSGINLGDSYDDMLRRLRFGFLRHDEVKGMATAMASSASSFGSWLRDLLRSTQRHPPQLLGVSLLHAGQVVPSVAVSMVARELWPDTLVVWGGPHISGIGRALLDDRDERRFAADLFVAGHAEQTFASILDHLSIERPRLRPQGYEQGIRGPSVVPRFENMELYDDPPVLPAQSTLGCAYGRCAFCTYPAIEPTPAKLDLCVTVESVVKQAQTLGATVAVKDSLVTPRRLQDIGSSVRGRVRWSACTKLNEKMDLQMLEGLSANGLATLEVGLESLLVETQRRVAKVHPPDLFGTFLENVANIPNLSIVVNYMTGFPWENEEESQATYLEVEKTVDDVMGFRGKVEHNQFELERLSPMARTPERFGIDPRSMRLWPWASVVEYGTLLGDRTG